jgi:phosphoenolpyruvate synthase/pyruvate phosphate dikinase
VHHRTSASNPSSGRDALPTSYIATKCARVVRSRSRPKLKVGICGEHGGEPSSVEFCHLVGMDYVSCSPFRVPIARLAAAQAQLTHPRR